jgi:phosphoadenosine phosphosulfate reductase
MTATVTVIDRSRGITPRAFDRPGTGAAEPMLIAKLSQLQDAARGRDAHGILELALTGEFAGKSAVVSSFGAESAVLLHLVAQIDPNTPILFLNTGKLFGETLRYRDRLQDELGLGDIRSLAPNPADRARFDPEGTLWSKDTDACCNFRKVIPLKRALEPFAAQITGRKRFQTRERAAMQQVEFFEGRFRFNPLSDWTLAQLEAYTVKNNLPRHPLVEDGYPSIGCMPCTRRVAAGEDYRAGRWSGEDKDECGIHIGVDGEGI